MRSRCFTSQLTSNMAYYAVISPAASPAHGEFHEKELKRQQEESLMHFGRVLRIFFILQTP
jgi:hypothetical protein